MASGRPDYNLMTAIRGQYGTELKVVAVDSAGRIIMVPIGSTGNYMAVDASGYLSTIMKGIDGVTLRTIAVDGSGNILGLLQGWYEGAVKTLAVDAQGRMLAVLTDPEDVFGNPHYMGAAELAVRLGAIMSHERRGQVIWFDDFECGHLNKWVLTLNGADSLTELSTAYARNGAFSLYLYAGNAASRSAEANHYLPFPTLSKVGLEGWVALPSASNGYFYFGWYIYTGTTLYNYLIRLNPSTGTIGVLIGAGSWVNFSTALAPTVNQGLFVLKLVADLTTQKYVRCLFNDTEYDLSAYSSYSQVNATSRSMVLVKKAYNISEALTAYVDDVIVTQNEV